MRKFAFCRFAFLSLASATFLGLPDHLALPAQAQQVNTQVGNQSAAINGNNNVINQIIIQTNSQQSGGGPRRFESAPGNPQPWQRGGDKWDQEDSRRGNRYGADHRGRGHRHRD